MKNVLLTLSLLTFMSFTALSQADTYHTNYEQTFDFPNYGGDWIATAVLKVSVNQVRKIDKNTGDVQIQYTNNYHAHWEFYNTVTGARRAGPENQNVTGVYTFGADHYTNDRHWVYFYTNDPVFGAYHINYNILWTYNPVTGFMEVVDIQNEWSKNP